MKSDKKIAIIIAGPTASGKTSLAINLAKKFDTEVISVDSRQVFREMQIGTARPTDEELEGIPHHLLGNISIHDEFNAGIFEEEALKKINEIFTKKNHVVISGGTGLYLTALLHGFDSLPDKNSDIREELVEGFEESGITFLQEKLKKLDPEFYKTVEINNPQRMIRAIEVCILTGKTHAELKSGSKAKRPFSTLFFVLNPEREKLYTDINLRVDKMVAAGIEEEARRLYPYRDLNALQTVGYSEWFDYFDGKISRQEAINLIKQHTRNYAKRQLTWFRKQENVIWVKPENALEEILERVENKND